MPLIFCDMADSKRARVMIGSDSSAEGEGAREVMGSVNKVESGLQGEEMVELMKRVLNEVNDLSRTVSNMERNLNAELKVWQVKRKTRKKS